MNNEQEKLEREIVRLKDELNWQNMPNRREPLRGGYEFYINEEWTCLRDAALGEDLGFHAALMKTRYDPDDERVRVRRVLDDDAILKELAELKGLLNSLTNVENKNGLVDFLKSL
jgi:NTP pyrophosphatase (non-canonical NTP hydrolase)